jgi:hypothetical protein
VCAHGARVAAIGTVIEAGRPKSELCRCWLLVSGCGGGRAGSGVGSTASGGSTVGLTTRAGAAGGTTTGAVGGVGATIDGGVGATTIGGVGGVGAVTPELPPPYSGAVWGSPDVGDPENVPHIPPTFQVHVHPATPVSIVCAVSGDVVSPHVQTQFHVQVLGSGEELGGSAGGTDAGVCAGGALCGAAPVVSEPPACAVEPVEPAGSG